MIFQETKLTGAYVIEPERREDDRGFFARVCCSREFEAHQLETRIVQANIAYNRQRGTLRGLHIQVSPCEETKLIHCVRGAIYDVIVDLRADSPTRGEWTSVELNETNRRLLYVPRGCAHGYQTLMDNTEVFYQVSQFYTLECERGIRYDDPAFGIDWPLPVTAISQKDRNHPRYYQSLTEAVA